jgi:hypothetical protein
VANFEFKVVMLKKKNRLEHSGLLLRKRLKTAFQRSKSAGFLLTNVTLAKMADVRHCLSGRL